MARAPENNRRLALRIHYIRDRARDQTHINPRGVLYGVPRPPGLPVSLSPPLTPAVPHSAHSRGWRISSAKMIDYISSCTICIHICITHIPSLTLLLDIPSREGVSKTLTIFRVVFFTLKNSPKSILENSSRVLCFVSRNFFLIKLRRSLIPWNVEITYVFRFRWLKSICERAYLLYAFFSYVNFFTNSQSILPVFFLIHKRDLSIARFSTRQCEAVEIL